LHRGGETFPDWEDKELSETFEDILETALLSEAALAVDWNRPEEDLVWSHLQQGVLFLNTAE
jgi:hypothetical protein